MAGEAPLFKVAALSKLSHFGELPSHRSGRTGHTCACTRTYAHACTDQSHPYILTDLQTQVCSHTHWHFYQALAGLQGSWQAGRHQTEQCPCVRVCARFSNPPQAQNLYGFSVAIEADMV